LERAGYRNNKVDIEAMKKQEGQKRADFLLLQTILGKYLKQYQGDEGVESRLFQSETIEDIVRRYYEIKYLIQRIEWLEGEGYVEEMLRYMAANQMSAAELCWAVDMFALEKQAVLNRIEGLKLHE